MKPSVVVGYDQAPHSALALDEAADEALRRDAVLTVVHAFAPATSATRPRADPAIQHAERAAALRIAEQGAEHARSRRPGLPVQARAAAGSAASVLAESAPAADLLVIGRHGHDGLAELVLGAVTTRVAARPACPTMVVRGSGREAMGTVLAAVDIEDPADEVLAFAFDEARLRRTGLKALSVREAFWPRVYAGGAEGLRAASIQAADNAELALEHLLGPWRTKYPDVHVRHEIADGSSGTVLTAATSHADLVVAGAHHHRGGGLPVDGTHVGPTLNHLLVHAECPVVIVPRAPLA
jgi:nucleotide-binding universal stress UspA family protein